jgi:hypothetical protein
VGVRYGQAFRGIVVSEINSESRERVSVFPGYGQFNERIPSVGPGGIVMVI